MIDRLFYELNYGLIMSFDLKSEYEDYYWNGATRYITRDKTYDESYSHTSSSIYRLLPRSNQTGGLVRSLRTINTPSHKLDVKARPYKLICILREYVG